MNVVCKAFKWCRPSSQQEDSKTKKTSLFQCFRSYRALPMAEENQSKRALSDLLFGKRKERSPCNEPPENFKSNCDDILMPNDNVDALSSWSADSSSSSVEDICTNSQENMHNHQFEKDSYADNAAKRCCNVYYYISPNCKSDKHTPPRRGISSLIDNSDDSLNQKQDMQWTAGSVYTQLNFSGKPPAWLDQSFNSSVYSRSFSPASLQSVDSATNLHKKHGSNLGSSDSLNLPLSFGLLQSPPFEPFFTRDSLRRCNSYSSLEKPRANPSPSSHWKPSPSRWNTKRQFLPLYDEQKILTLEPGIGIIDTHCHLDFLFKRLDYTESYADFIEENSSSYPKCYEGCIAIFCDPLTFCKRAMWEKFLEIDGVWAAFGCHPHLASKYNLVVENDLKESIVHERVVALGEIGLDYSCRNNTNHDVQKEVFKRQLTIALDNHLPIVIHCRDAHEDCLAIMKEMVPKLYYIHRHCFTSDWKEAKLWLDAFPNLFLGITALVTFPSAKEVHEVVRNIPLTRLLLETDTPYFVPSVVHSQKGHSHPGMVIHVAAQVAAIKKDVTIEDVLRITRINTYLVYGI